MTDFNPTLGVVVSGNEIVVVLPGSIYTVTYFKRRDSYCLLAKNIATKDDPRIPMTAAEFLAKAWKLPMKRRESLGGSFRSPVTSELGPLKTNLVISALGHLRT